MNWSQYANRFGIPEDRAKRMPDKLLKQLDRCKDDASRRLLLGLSQVLRKEAL